MKIQFLRCAVAALMLMAAVSLVSAQNGPEVTVGINEQFLNAFLDSMFTNLNAPSMPLVITAADKERTAAQAKACPNVIKLVREEAGVRTAVKLEQGRITAPLAFAGSYDSTLLGCLELRGWAATTWTLDFDRARQAVVARVTVNEVRLTNVPALAGASLGRLVQSAIDQRINPLELLKLDQLSTKLPIPPAGGALRMVAKEVKPEILPGEVRLHIKYEFLPDIQNPSK